MKDSVPERGANDKKYRDKKNYETSTGKANSKVHDLDEMEDSLERDLEEIKPTESIKQRDIMIKPIDGTKLKSSKRLQALKLGDIYKLL